MVRKVARGGLKNAATNYIHRGFTTTTPRALQERGLTAIKKVNKPRLHHIELSLQEDISTKEGLGKGNIQ